MLACTGLQRAYVEFGSLAPVRRCKTQLPQCGEELPFGIGRDRARSGPHAKPARVSLLFWQSRFDQPFAQVLSVFWTLQQDVAAKELSD